MKTVELTKPVFIYQLLEYGSHVPRYVGKTCRSIEIRRDGHVDGALKGCVSYKDNWIRGVINHGGLIHVELLEIVSAGGDHDEAERRWIKNYREMGCPLTNLTDGGDGTLGLKWR